MGDSETIAGIRVVPNPAVEYLNSRQLVDYRNHRESLINWCLSFGKDPSTAEGYAVDTVDRRATSIDKFYRWVWENGSGYTTDVTRDDADDYLRELAYEEYSTNYASNVQKALKMLFKWRHHEHGKKLWEPDVTFSSSDSPSNPRDYFTRGERTQLREAALEYGSVPSYTSLSASERNNWKALLAQRFQLPKDAVGKAEFERANGFKIPSLVWTILDAGLRPVEVSRATVRWVDADNAVLRIPAEESAKGDEHWVVSLQSRTAEMLDKWLTERELYPRYEGRDELWLTREGNPYRSQSLKYLLEQLSEQAGISTENRSISTYTIRHSVGTLMAREEGLAAAQSQLRHKSVQTTMKYDQAPIEDRRNALDKMG